MQTLCKRHARGVRNMNITVYLGSAMGNSEIYRQQAIRLGTWIGGAGHRLIYGGSRIGLMGILAEAVLQAGGEVIGVEPEFFVNSCLQHDGITQLIVTKTMAERKAEMISLGDAFIAFPGGTGTLEEITEVISQVRLGQNTKPCILYNLKGYYDPLRRMLERMVSSEFLDEESLEKVRFADSVEEIAALLEEEHRIG